MIPSAVDKFPVMKMVHDDVHVDRSDDPANSIFPRGKLAKLEGKRSPAKGKKGKNGNAARGNYGNVNGRAICPKQRRSAAPEPPRTPLQSGIHSSSRRLSGLSIVLRASVDPQELKTCVVGR